MATLKTNIRWLDELLPEGILIPSSTLISGPGGTGKPLVEFQATGNNFVHCSFLRPP